MIPLGMAWSTVPNASMVEVVHAAAAAGFSSVGLRAVQIGASDSSFLGGDRDELLELKRVSLGEGISILRTSGFWLDGRYSSERFYPHLDASRQLGARYITVLGTDDDTSRMTDDFADLCQRAAGFGLLATVEFAPFSTIRNVEDAYALLQRSAQVTATITLDALHLFRSGGTPSNVLALPASCISVAQLCDARSRSSAAGDLLNEARSDRLDAGEGDLPLREFMQCVPSNVPLEIEVPCRAQRDLLPTERARRAAKAARDFLQGL